MSDRRPCPCPPCKAAGATQIPRTIRRHLETHGVPKPAFLRSSSLNIAAPRPSRHSSLTFASPNSSQANSLEINRDLDDYIRPSSLSDAESNGNGRSASASPVSLDEEFDGLDFRNRSREIIVRTPSPSGSELSDEEEELVVIEEDPNFIPRERIFAEVDDQDDPLDDPEGLAPAFDEHPAIRNAYIHVFANAAFGSATHIQSQNSLIALHSTISALEDPNNPIEGLDAMALTLPTLERRLGVNPDAHITYFFLCPDCWKRHHPRELVRLTSPQCAQDLCTGVLYSVKRTARGAEKRTPTKIMPYHSPKDAIARLMRRPGIWEQCQLWRKDGDHGPSEPMTPEEFDESLGMDDPLDDIHDGYRWRSVPAFLERRWDPRRRDVDDVDIFPGPQRRFVSLPCGLLVAINIDWFQAVKGRIHSSGGVYLTILNLPREIRYLAENTIFPLAIPGPYEPSLEQLNECMDPVASDLNDMSKGQLMSVYGHPHKEEVHTSMLFLSADTPARLKTMGFTSMNSDRNLCYVCPVKGSSLVTADCFDLAEVTTNLRDPWKQLRYKFLAANSNDDDYRELIAERKGVRVSSFDIIPGLNPITASPPGLMHAAFLRMMNVVHKEILHTGGMFTVRSKKHLQNPIDRFDGFLESLWWPGDSGRVKTRLGHAGGKVKADEWRNGMLVCAVALFEAWRKGDALPDGDAPYPKEGTKAHKAQEKQEELMNKRRKKESAQHETANPDDFQTIDDTPTSRNYRDHYEAVLLFCAAIRIFASRSITRRESERAQELLSKACTLWADMHCHLTPNFHISMHFDLFILLLGPAYAWWEWAYERHLGRVSRFNTNGRSGGEMEATMMRKWLKMSLCQDLLLTMQGLPNRTSEDDKAIEVLLQGIKGEGERQRQRGTFLTYLAAMGHRDGDDPISLPQQSKAVNLRTIGLYELVIVYLRHLWPDKQLVTDGGAQQGLIFYSTAVKSYATASVRNLKYGSHLQHGGKPYSYGFVNGRVAARIDHLLRISINQPNGLPPLITTVALIRRFESAEELVSNAPARPPWYTWGVDLGIGHWKHDVLGELEAIPMDALSGRFCFGKIKFAKQKLWITFSMDHTKQEPDRPS